MVSQKSVEKQLQQLHFNIHSWGRAEVQQLPHILIDDEEIYELVNGMYEGGFALLVATDIRLLLIDKKPLNYLTVEDMRFDNINELDYGHQLIGAQISIAAGSKNLKFRSYNQKRLRKLIGHVQHCMAETKKKESQGQENQKQHLEQINQQLQAYLIAQHQQQQDMRRQLEQAGIGSASQSADSAENASNDERTAPKLSPELSDYLFAQSLLKQYKEQHAQQAQEAESTVAPLANVSQTNNKQAIEPKPVQLADTGQQQYQKIGTRGPKLAELYADGVQEVFGKQAQTAELEKHGYQQRATSVWPTVQNPLEINALKVAYAKLPLALRNRKFGGLSFHAHSKTTLPARQQQTPIMGGA